MRRILSAIKFAFWGFPKAVVKLFRTPKLYDPKETYFPEYPTKSKFSILCDQIRYIAVNRNINEFYFLYGFDVKKKGFRNQKDYLDYSAFMRRRDYLNNHPNKREIYSYTGILRDKFFFSMFMDKMGFPIPKTIGIIDDNVLVLSDGNKDLPLSEMPGLDGHYICKPINGIGGVGILSLDIKDGRLYISGEETSYENFCELVSKDKFFVQERLLSQHPLMSSLYPKSINTLRITTVRDLKTGNIELMGCMLLMGAREAIVSNWHYGGVIIDVHTDGFLDKYGYSLYEKKITAHPETGVVFETFKVPYFEEAVALCKECHGNFYGIHSVGWDLAVMPDGLMFIEGNDNWGMAAHQMVSGGLMKKFRQYYFE